VLEILAIKPGSTATGIDIKRGDTIVSINGKAVNDVIDYQFLVADPHVAIVFQRRKGGRKTIRLDKDPDDTLGFEFAPLTIRRCRNKCIFCFVDQMPAACRKSLYVKDDDYRASFLYGNYITLGALDEPDWQRIFSQRLSPLYISVHATDPTLRAFIVGNKKAPDIIGSLKRLAAGGIRMHTQVVLCPDINDGEQLQKTLADLSGLFPAVASIAVVPVGLTMFRKGLFPLRAFTRSEARAVIDSVTQFGSRFRREYGTRLVFSSDEFYVKAGVPVPPFSFYEDFPQIENGVGMVADFLRNAARTRLPARIKPLKATVVSGVSFSGILKEELVRLKAVAGLRVNQVVVPNKFFGPSVTVAGLLTGSDIAATLAGKRLGDLVIIPFETLKPDENVFLDGMGLSALGNMLCVPIVPTATFGDLVSVLRKGV